MCLTWDWSPKVVDIEAAAARLSEHASCAQVQIVVLDLNNGGRRVISRMPIKSKSSVMAMYPTNDAEFLVPCAGQENLVCVADLLLGVLDPGSYVEVPHGVSYEQWASFDLEAGFGDGPIYRALGQAEAAPNPDPVITLPPAACVKNMDGGVTFVLPTSKQVLSDEEIACSPFKDRSTYLEKLGKACFESLTSSMDINGVEKGFLFEMDEDDTSAIAPEAMVNFLHELFPNLRTGADMLVAIPPFDDFGKPKMDGAFTFAFHYNEARGQLPLLGLVHGIDHTTLGSEQVVEEDYFIASNSKLEMDIVNEETGVKTCINLQSAHDYLPGINHPEYVKHFGEDASRWTGEDSSDLLAYSGYDRDLWERHCTTFQQTCKDKFYSALGPLTQEMGLSEYDPSALYCTNLVGLVVPKTAICASVGKDALAHTGYAVVKRMHAARQAAAESAKTPAERMKTAERVTAVERAMTPVERVKAAEKLKVSTLDGQNRFQQMHHLVSNWTCFR